MSIKAEWDAEQQAVLEWRWEVGAKYRYENGQLQKAIRSPMGGFGSWEPCADIAADILRELVRTLPA